MGGFHNHYTDHAVRNLSRLVRHLYAAAAARVILLVMWGSGPPVGLVWLAFAVSANAQAPPIQRAWDDLIGTGVAQPTPDPILIPRQAPGNQRSQSDFADH